MDTVSYADATARVWVNLSSTSGWFPDLGDSDQLSGIESVIGSAFGDMLTGNVAANALSGGGGNDRLMGGLGGDTLTGGAGADVFDYDALADSPIGAGSRDVITDFQRNWMISISGISTLTPRAAATRASGSSARRSFADGRPSCTTRLLIRMALPTISRSSTATALPTSRSRFSASSRLGRVISCCELAAGSRILRGPRLQGLLAGQNVRDMWRRPCVKC